MLTDLVLSPFGADPVEMVRAAVLADAGFGGIYTYDHFSGVVAGRAWSRDPFVVLGAIATATTRARIGVLVANMTNRSPAQLASAVDTLMALAPRRVMCGLGAGAAPGTKFAAEHDLIGRQLGDREARHAQLVATIAALRAMWSGADDAVPAVVSGAVAPPIVVGASSRATIELATRLADGVNMRRTEPDELKTRIALARSAGGGRPFEVSVFDDLDPTHPLGGDPGPLAAAGADRRTLAVAAPYPLEAIEGIAANLAAGDPYDP